MEDCTRLFDVEVVLTTGLFRTPYPTMYQGTRLRILRVSLLNERIVVALLVIWKPHRKVLPAELKLRISNPRADRALTRRKQILQVQLHLPDIVQKRLPFDPFRIRILINTDIPQPFPLIRMPINVLLKLNFDWCHISKALHK